VRLLSLKLRSFRQHKETDILFQDGITGIIGRNGAGKSTLLEAIAWALYGQKAVQRMERGKADTIRSRGSKRGEVPEVTLDFDLAGQPFRVVRRLNDAALFSGDTQLATGTENVTQKVGQLLGMDPQAFFTSFFTGQKDLAFLKDVSSKGREAYIGKLLGYERLSKARALANDEKLQCGRTIDGLVQGLGDPESIKARKAEQKAAVKEARAKLEEGEALALQAQAELDKIVPEVDASLNKHKLHESLGANLNLVRSQEAVIRENIARVQGERDGIEAAQAEVQELQPLAREYEELKTRNEHLLELKAADAQRSGIRTAITQTTTQISRTLESIRVLEEQFASLIELRKRAEAAAQQNAEMRSELEAAQSDLVRRRSSAEAGARTARARQSELAEHLRQVEKAGPDGVCPTCERPLGAEFDKVTGQMKRDLSAAGQSVREMDAEIASLKAQPAELTRLKTQFEDSEKSLSVAREAVTRAETAGEQLKREQTQLADLRAQLQASEKKLSAIEGDFDPDELERVRSRGRELKPQRDRLTQLQARVARRDEVERDLSAQTARLNDLLKNAAEVEAQIAALAFDEKAHNDLVASRQKAEFAARTAREEAVSLKSDVRTAEALLKDTERQEEEQKSRLKVLDEKKSEQRHLEALVQALDELRAALSAQIKPRLEEAASDFLSQVAPERYSQMDLDDDFAPRLYEEGEHKPVVSGGEEDILHLCLRLGVSQMIAERAGIELGLLILDEVFGSLDELRRENVIALLDNLKGSFPQILLITHIDSIHDMVDRCIWVDYDQDTQSSVLRDGAGPSGLPSVEEILELA
jgi:exonuclease SbcC